MKRLDRALSGIENVLAAGTLGLAALITIINIIVRQFGQAFFWVEESVIYLIIFSTFIGAVITLRHNEHVSVDILGVFFKERGKKWLALVAGLVTLTYLAIMSVLGWMLIFEPFSTTTITPVLKLPLWVVELAVPIGMTLMFLRAVEMLWRTWKYGSVSAEPEDILEAEAEATGLTMEEIRASHEAITQADAMADHPVDPQADATREPRTTDDPKEGGR